jgi:hypothetical protein
VASLLSLSSHNQKAGVSASAGSGSNAKKGGGGVQQQGSGRKSNDKNKPVEKSASFLVSTLEVLEALIKLASSSSNNTTKHSANQTNQYVIADNEASKGIILSSALLYCIQFYYKIDLRTNLLT